MQDKLVRYQTEFGIVTGNYQAEDPYVHPAKAEIFTNVPQEWLTSATPIVAIGVEATRFLVSRAYEAELVRLI
jgi:hypothetical protein